MNVEENVIKLSCNQMYMIEFVFMQKLDVYYFRKLV